MDYDIVEAFNRIEDELTRSMIRNLDHHRAQELEEGYDWSQWQVAQLAALDEYKKRNLEKYPEIFDNINSKIPAMIAQQRAAGRADQEVEILKRMKDHKAEPPKGGMTGKFFKKNDRKLNSLIKATTNDFKKGEYAMLRQANDQYRKIIFNAQMYAASGAGTYEKAVDMATKDFLKAGITSIEYKDGSRHTMKEYSEMCIQTASKRAYLTGEGEKRKEWGIHLVIMNKRGNPCPLCAKWAGKILIDNVWSGGSRADGDYPLMSEAIAAGLYHPRCRDIHTTYFGDPIKRDSTYSQKEQTQLVKDYNQDQKQKYAQTMVTKLDRMSKYSLDEENKRVYDARAQEWKKLSVEWNMIIDHMGFPKIFDESGINIKAYRIKNTDNIYSQTYSKDAQATMGYIQEIQDELLSDLSEVVVCKDIQGIAAYDHVNNRLYVNEKLKNKKFLDEQLSSKYFVAENELDVLKHEMYHKKHWDNIVTKGKDYDTIKQELETDLHKYIKMQMQNEKFYISKTVSKNAERVFIKDDNLNEVIAEVLLQEEKGIVVDKNLLMLVRRCIE